jgi:hypothetical protein
LQYDIGIGLANQVRINQVDDFIQIDGNLAHCRSCLLACLRVGWLVGCFVVVFEPSDELCLLDTLSLFWESAKDKDLSSHT